MTNMIFKGNQAIHLHRLTRYQTSRSTIITPIHTTTIHLHRRSRAMRVIHTRHPHTSQTPWHRRGCALVGAYLVPTPNHAKMAGCVGAMGCVALPAPCGTHTYLDVIKTVVDVWWTTVAGCCMARPNGASTETTTQAYVCHSSRPPHQHVTKLNKVVLPMVEPHSPQYRVGS